MNKCLVTTAVTSSKSKGVFSIVKRTEPDQPVRPVLPGTGLQAGMVFTIKLDTVKIGKNW